MKLVGKVPVESLDEERLTNIERKLVVQVSEMSQRPLRAPSRLFAYAAVAAAVGVALLVGYRLRGHAQVSAPAPQQYAVKDGALDLGDAQITGKDFSVVRFGTRVEVALDKPGKLDCHVEHKPGRLFVVHAGNVEIEDVGTRFSVDFDGTNVDVQVTEGAVKVKHAGKELEVAAGNAWTIELGPITIAQLQQRGAQVAANDVQQPQPPTPPTPANVTPAQNVGSAGGSNAGSAQGSAAHQPKPKKSATYEALEKDSYDQPIDVGTKEPKAAIAKYRELLKTMSEGEDKARVLYSIAVMQHRSKQDDGALYTISGLLKRQGGDTYQSALWLNVRIVCLKAFDDDCRRAAEKYLGKFESGPQSGVAQDILKEISRGD